MKVLLCFSFLLWGFSVIHFSLEILLGLISSLICSAFLISSQPVGFRKVPVFIFHLNWSLFISQMLTDVVMRASPLSFCKECWFYGGVYGFIDSRPVGVHSRAYTRVAAQDLHGVPRPFEKGFWLLSGLDKVAYW